jgi:dTDP-4-dehydrorhamnose reductase
VKFLVIGASGFVGGNFLEYVRSLGFEAVGTQSRHRRDDLVKFDLLGDRIADCVGHSFFEGAGPVCVVICAVISDMDLCLQDREVSHQINVKQTIRLIQDVQALKAQVVFLSSCFVFDGTKGYYAESDAIAPVNEYGRHKAEVEEYLNKHVPEAFIARLDKIVGDQPAQKQLFAYWYQRLVKQEPITCIQGSLLSPTYVLDVAQGIVLAVQKKLSGIYHLSNSEFFYRDELARQFAWALGRPATIISQPLETFNFPDKRALKSYLDGSRFAMVTGLRFTPMSTVFRKFRGNSEIVRKN